MKKNSVLRFAVAAALTGVSSVSVAAWNAGSNGNFYYATELPYGALTLKGPNEFGSTGRWKLYASPINFGPTTTSPLIMTVKLTQGAKFTASSAPVLHCEKSNTALLATATMVIGGTVGYGTAIFEIASLGTSGVQIAGTCDISFAEIRKASASPHQTISASITFKYGNFASGTVGGPIVRWSRGLRAENTDTPGLDTALLESNFYFLDDSRPLRGSELEFEDFDSSVLNADGNSITVHDAVETSGSTITFTGEPLRAIDRIYFVVDGDSCSASEIANISGVGNGSTSITVGGSGLTPSILEDGSHACFVFTGEDSIPYGPINATINPRAKTGYNLDTSYGLGNSLVATVYRNAISALAYNIPGSANSDQAFIRITNTSNAAGRVFGQLYGQDGTDLGFKKMAEPTEFTGQKTIVFTSAQLETLFGATWSGRARLIVSSETPSLAIMNTIRTANGTLVNMSPANVARQCSYGFLGFPPLDGLGSGGVNLGVNYASDCTPVFAPSVGEGPSTPAGGKSAKAGKSGKSKAKRSATK